MVGALPANKIMRKTETNCTQRWLRLRERERLTVVEVLGVAPENPRGFNYPSRPVFDMTVRDSPWLDVTWAGGDGERGR